MILAILAILGLVNRSDFNFLNITRLNWGFRDQEMSAKRKRVVLSMAQKLCIIGRFDKGEKAVELSVEYLWGNLQ